MGNDKLRCKDCNKLLGMVDGSVEIVCPRCGGLNKYNAKEKKIEFIPKSLRTRVTSSGVTFS